ncbi:MAG: hypothetical protein O2960_29320, partial [Verrucomicrobia bacterium]|nr:hypothetical protein [Verrucomicrobiota bacterium]
HVSDQLQKTGTQASKRFSFQKLLFIKETGPEWSKSPSVAQEKTAALIPKQSLRIDYSEQRGDDSS